MLDTDTKRRIDSARDILVGKVPDPKSQVEQITIALIYKFMDDMDTESEELGGERSFFKGEFEKYAWRKIFDPRMGGFEILALYSEAIIKMNVNPNIPQLFRDIFKNAYLPYRDPETLKAFLKTINEFTYDHSERLGDAFEYLLSVLGSQGEAGQFRTPRHIIDFMVALIDPKKEEVIMDPACGTAGFLISSYKHIIKTNSSNYNPETDTRTFETKGLSLSEIVINSKNFKGDKLTPDERNRLANNIKGYDISPDMVRLSLVNMYLHGLHAPHIYEYDTLTSEDNWNEYADVILANPPFMSPKGGIRPHKRFSITSNRSEVLFVDYIAEHLTPDGRAAVIVPEGIIFQSGTAYKNLRKMLVEKYLVGVISLPAGVFQPYSGVKTSILWLDRTLAKKTDKILFVKIENDGFDLGAQRRPIKKNDLPSVFKNLSKYHTFLNQEVPPEFDKFQLIDKSILSSSGEYNLSGERYIKTEARLSIYDIVKLGDVAEIIMGQAPPGIDCNMEGIGTPFVKVGNFDKVYPRIEEWTTNPLRLAGKNDTLICVVGATIGKINRSINCAIGRSVAAVRPYEQKINSSFLYYNLIEWTSKLRNMSQGSAIGVITKEMLYEVDLALPPLSVQEEIVAEIESYQKIIDGARQVVDNYKPRIDIDPEWPMMELGEVVKPQYGFTERASDEGNARFIRITDIGPDGKLIAEDSKYINLTREAQKCIVKQNDILVARTGATYGKTMIFEEDYPAVFASFLMRLNFDVNRVFPKYYWIFAQSEDYIIQAASLMTGGGQPQFNGNAIVKIKLPLPSLEIQKQIVHRIDREMAIVNTNNQLIKIFEQKIKARIARIWGEK